MQHGLRYLPQSCRAVNRPHYGRKPKISVDPRSSAAKSLLFSGPKSKGGFWPPFLSCKPENVLASLNVLCLPALGSLDDVELHGLAFLETAEALVLNGGVVHEYIFAILTADKTIPLGVIEPLYCSLFHCVAFPSC